MRIIYEAHYGAGKVEDFDDEQKARAKVEAENGGYIVTFVRGFDGRDRSSAMNKFDGVTWNGVNIHE